MKMGKGEASYFAWLDDGPPFQIIKSTFQEWWLRCVIRDHEEVSFTRKDLVLTLANKEGGAHVDSELEQECVRLSQENSLQYYFMVGNEARDWLNNPVPHTVRHIAHELLKTLYEQVPDVMADKPHGYGCRINGLPM